MTSRNRFGTGSLCRLPFVDIVRRQTIESAVFRIRQARVLRVRLRTRSRWGPWC